MPSIYPKPGAFRRLTGINKINGCKDIDRREVGIIYNMSGLAVVVPDLKLYVVRGFSRLNSRESHFTHRTRHQILFYVAR